ncbi:hypothetical protein HIM_06235 [Hirsutella minnesotensis 3608]|uniref:EDC4-like protein pdc1 beta-propeller domain-containing protein n=1 Tax=Hirsutella minnesotensis 3608 TaxID=1043627 RepID=A0A0F7ZNV8_9HYPO|nr:hypothetical protein HIM_06235 [Hirsutella minnesotensis 3608]
MDLPPAPTPPANSSGMPSNADRTAHLLNLLKFSGSGASSQKQPHPLQQQQHQSPPQQAPQPPPHHYTGDVQQQQQQHHPRQSSYGHAPFPAARIHQPAPAGADPSGLLAALMRGANESDEPRQPAQSSVASRQTSNSFPPGSPSSDTRSYLLSLLNQPKPSQTDQPLMTESSHSKEGTPKSPEAAADSSRYYDPYQQAAGSYQSGSHYKPQQPQQSAKSESFSDVQHSTSNVSSFAFPQTQESDMSALYQQVFGSLQQSSPQSHGTHGSAGPFHVLKKDHSPAASSSREHPVGNEPSPLASPPGPGRRAVDRSSSLHSHQSQRQPPKQTLTVSELEALTSANQSKDVAVGATEKATGDIQPGKKHVLASEDADPTSAEASGAEQQAVLRSDQNSPKPEPVTVEDAQVDDSVKIFEDAQDPPEVSIDQVTQEPVNAQESAKTHAVVDSWESADQEEIVVIEEQERAPVRVFNLPMKPWISISIQEDSTEPRPLFRDESIMDIARLKKEFDQMDRNLYTASQTYMTYGMSKQGGLRVIRQDDGKDAKVFTDTKDRIFNVAMSVTPHDAQGIQREAILGTGISGTVYWVQIKEGEKDHIDDAHLEQYGFALPPLPSQETDAPGGVIKTRARASSMHPEFFAVCRGKTINFVWPSFIMSNKLFKAVHDRVVDSDKLQKQCSLQINMGKSGKDFIFSQDDTVVVSLEKSGRVKFWDVRKLTATKEGSDPRAPLPAHTSLELKEPLLALESTPEGEKARPTSVMLVDKQRPFQKRCALRYMIIGMKQNHTLQLWDLALGKPVQEFNLPHSSEADAMCSVMYHPASGMIVIGHPTRNSVYFAHLSAPKYGLKGVSQADYIQRLVAQDPSIPQPDSTAVISGIREYSFANRGIIRSLDILCTPAMAQDADEPPLFELYAMHSKGVACLLIKQYELGWSKDNKVLDGVDAVKEGAIVVSKLKTPPAPEAPAPPTVAEQAQIRIATRPATKESPPQATSGESALQDLHTLEPPAKADPEKREAEVSTPSSKDNQVDKPERKNRKKKGAAKEAEPSANGTHNSPRAVPSGNRTETVKSAGNVSMNGIPPEMLDSAITNLEARLTTSVSETLKSSLKNLQGHIDKGAQARDDTFNKQQLNLLNMVSEVLNENTQKVLESLIHHQFSELVVPAIGDHASKAVQGLVKDHLQPKVASAIQGEIQRSLPHAVSKSLRSDDFVGAVSDRVSSAVATSVQEDLSALTQRLSATLSSVAAQSAQRIAHEMHQKHQEQLEHIQARHAADAGKIDQLLAHVGQLTDMMSNMAASQSTLQAELAKMKQQPTHERPSGPGVHSQSSSSVPYGMQSQGYGMGGGSAPSHRGSYAASQGPLGSTQYMNSPQYMRGPQPVASSHGAGPSEHTGPSGVGSLAGAFASSSGKGDSLAEHELMKRVQRVEQAIQEDRLQEAVVQWIQSGHEKEIFRRCLGAYPPSRFAGLPPILLLVIIATISKDLKPNPLLKQEIDWIEMAVRAFGDSLPNYDWEGHSFGDVMKSATQTMELLVLRLNPLIACYKDGYPLDPFLAKVDKGKIEWVVQSSQHILESFGGAARRYE